MAASEAFRPARDRRKKAGGRRLTVSAETRKAYEETIRSLDERREQAKFLPEELRGKR